MPCDHAHSGPYERARATETTGDGATAIAMSKKGCRSDVQPGCNKECTAATKNRGCKVFCNLFCNVFCNVAASAFLGMNLIQSIVHDFNLFNESSQGRRTARRLTDTHPLLANITGPSDAIAVLRAAEPDDHSAILNALIAASTNDPTVTQVVLHAYLPAILRPRRIIAFHDGTEREDFTVDLIEAALAAIATLTTEPAAAYPGTRLSRAIDNAARRWQREHNLRPEPFDEITDDTSGTVLLNDTGADDRSHDIEFLLDVICDAAHLGRITPADATFTLRTILGDDTTHTEAARRFVGLRAMQKTQKRTTEAIVEHALAKAA